MKRLELLIENGELAGKRIAVGEMGVRLGRSSANDIHVPDEELSRNHCLFEPCGEFGIRVTDLASANGTKVNGVMLGTEMRELVEGDEIAVGTMLIRVVGDKLDKPATSVDLGLDKGDKPAAKRPPLMNVLWGVAAVVVVLALLLIVAMPGGEEGTSGADIAAKEDVDRVVELSYEKVVADSASIFRYFMTISREGDLKVTIDDISGEVRRVDRPAKRLDAATLKRVDEMMLDPALLSIESQHVGPDGEPPKLRSCVLKVIYAKGVRTFSVVNAREPAVFARVCEQLETLAKNELGIWAIQRSAAELVRDAAASAAIARTKWEERDVEYGNIDAAIRAYREAIGCLDTVDPKPPEYESYLSAHAEAEKELDKRYREQRFKADRALNLGDWATASAELQILCKIVPDRNDERNIEAMNKLSDVERRLKGGK